MHRLTALLLLTLLTPCGLIHAQPAAQGGLIAPPAQVILYSHGSWTSQMKPVSRNSIFHGGIWQDGNPLVIFMDHLYPTNDRFLVIDLPPGTHTFGLGEGRKPRKSSLLTLDLQPGHRYYLRAHASDNYLSDTSRLELTPCQAAHDDLAKGEPLDQRAVRPEKRALLSAAQALPACP